MSIQSEKPTSGLLRWLLGDEVHVQEMAASAGLGSVTNAWDVTDRVVYLPEPLYLGRKVGDGVSEPVAMGTIVMKVQSHTYICT